MHIYSPKENRLAQETLMPPNNSHTRWKRVVWPKRFLKDLPPPIYMEPLPQVPSTQPEQSKHYPAHRRRRIIGREADLVMGEQAAMVPPKKAKASSSNTQLTKTVTSRRTSLLPQKKQMKQTTPSKKN